MHSLEKLLVLFLLVSSWRFLFQSIRLYVLKATADGRALVAIGCAEGVWIGFRHDSRCPYSHILCSSKLTNVSLAMRRVLHLKMVTQCAMLEDFGMFLVLADKVLFTSNHFYVILTCIYRLCLHIISRLSFRRRRRVLILLRHRRGLMELEMFTSSASATKVDGHWLYT